MSTMENNLEEELQDRVEKGKERSTDRSSRAYRLVFDALQHEPEFRLSAKFSENVLQRLVIIEGRNQYTWFVIVVAGFIIAAGVTIALTGFDPDFGFLKRMSRYSGVFAFGMACIVFLQWLDKKLVREKQPGI